ncbi:transcriptional regulator [Hallella multisaccharivorax DSM 17128]|uniref:Histone family protein DNA-binding protein n=1 Tax=Hallella multisaccharivorax DSM 17128 TaxID=688246 RepID=F8N692_9BACT|nr:HU family DNA-binding protein [Hallella multisaccharivorax]EGN56173.1 histone family protein DNA-binding protein [Hallella multisaccharivorax DSM 17128]GJG29676.1 transcriptional regulator [Hallella multisaccharivorax DSM 17128]
MTKADLIKKISEAAGINATEAKKALEATTDSIKQALVAGDKVQLIGFGTFSVTERPAREGKNPRTGEPLHIDAKKVAKFKAGAEFENQINA